MYPSCLLPADLNKLAEGHTYGQLLPTVTIPRHGNFMIHARAFSTEPKTLSHIDGDGNARMVDVTGKGSSQREARASGHITLSSQAFQLVLQNSRRVQGDKITSGGKGDVVGVARLAGIMAAKNTSHMIPLCHALLLTHISVDFDLCAAEHRVVVRSCVRCVGVTGVEMEALTAVGVALLTVYDMTKAVSKSSVISDIQLDHKTGGKSGDYSRPKEEGTHLPSS